nr:MAG TPA: hypothetical protein [Caudoviricetes sp.]
MRTFWLKNNFWSHDRGLNPRPHPYHESIAASMSLAVFFVYTGAPTARGAPFVISIEALPI